jgi:DNA polymerase-3 subunit beta
MKVILLADNLQKKLSFVSHAISSRAQLPILSNILIEAKDGKLYLSATDLEIGIEVAVPAQIEDMGATTVPAKLFTELVNSLPDEKITLSLEKDTLFISSKKTKANIQTISRDEFPTLYDEKGEEVLRMQMDILKKDMVKVAFSASTETTRPALSGVLIQKNEESLLFVATDGYRLSLKRNKPEMYTFKDEKPMIVPVRVIREALSFRDGEISLYISSKNNQVMFAQEDTILVGRLIEAEFPKFEKIIPTDVATTVSFDREELLKAVKTCSIFARETANIIKLSLNTDKIIVSAKTPSLGENVVEVEAKLIGEENEIAFNAKYLLDALSNINDEELNFEMTGPLNAGVFKIANDPTFLHLIMPIRL